MRALLGAWLAVVTLSACQDPPATGGPDAAGGAPVAVPIAAPSSAPSSATGWKGHPTVPSLAPHPPLPGAPASTGAAWTSAGDEGCSSCHAAEAAAWRGSHHDLADTPPDLPTDTPRFDGKPVRMGGVTMTPKVVKGALHVVVDDAGGAHDHRVIGRIGVAPLQQYLVDGGSGRVLVAPGAWDTVKGGWFDPSVGGAVGDPKDPYYWAGLTGTWNHMCADCHTTTFQEGYGDHAYTSTWRSPDVGCTGCHGPTAAVEVRTQAGQMQACGFCHSRREPLGHGHTPGAPTYDEIVPELLDGQVYGADGSIRAPEEAFEYGSFAQSRMFDVGVTCTDCHDPHSGNLLAPGAQVCDRCHDAATYTATTHTGHAASAGPGAPTCIDCHMGSATYMGVHVRHDHHFRVPDADTLKAAARPGPCAACHQDGRLPSPPAHPTTHTLLEREFTGLVVSARRAGGMPGQSPEPGTLDQLARAATNPAVGEVRRASAVALLARLAPKGGGTLYAAMARDPSPALRRAAAEALALTPGGASILDPLLGDPRRAVRFAAVRGAAPSTTGAWALVLDEVRAAAAHSDVASDHTNLGVLLGMGGRAADAEAELRLALRIDPTFLPARQNLAVVLAQAGRREEAQQVLDAAP